MRIKALKLYVHQNRKKKCVLLFAIYSAVKKIPSESHASQDIQIVRYRQRQVYSDQIQSNRLVERLKGFYVQKKRRYEFSIKPCTKFTQVRLLWFIYLFLLFIDQVQA